MGLCCRSDSRSPGVRWWRILLCVALFTLLARLVYGAAPPPEIARLIRQLGHDDFDQREAASKQLSERGEEVMAALKLAATSHDAEVRRRSLELVAEIERRLYGEQAILLGHGGGLWGAAFAPDGKTAITCSDDKSLRQWELATGRQIARLEMPSAVNCARYFRDGKRLLVGLADGKCGIYSAETGRLLVAIGSHTDEVVALEILPGETEAVTVSRDRSLKHWDLTVPQLRRAYQGHTDMIRNVAVAPDGRQVATASFDGTIRLWDLESGETAQVIQPGAGMAFTVAFCASGSKLLSGTADGTVRLWDVASGEELQRFEGHTGFVYSTLFLPGGRRLLSASEDRTIRIWNVSSGQEERTYRGHTDYVRHLRLSPDGLRFLSASKDQSARLWSVPRE